MFNFMRKNNSINLMCLSFAFLGISTVFPAYSAVNGPSGKYEQGGKVVWSADITETVIVTSSGTSDYIPGQIRATYFGIGKAQSSMGDCSSISQLNLGKSSDGLYTGIVLSEDVILFLRGSATGKTGLFTEIGQWSSYGVYTSHSIPDPSYSWCAAAQEITSFSPGNNARFSGKISLYVGPNAKLGIVNIPGIWLFKGLNNTEDVRAVLMNTSEIEIVQPRSCTISTDNNIIFPSVDPSDSQDNQPLANKTGNLTVNCDDASNAPVTVEFNGTKGRYTDTLALSMRDVSGSAPAEVRGFIGKNIPLTGQCNGQSDGYPGVVYFAPNAGLEKITLMPGENKYNWVLCSKGQNKTGRSSGFARLILSWE